MTLNVFLVEHNSPFPAGKEGQQVRAGIQRSLLDMYRGVLKSKGATPPKGHAAKANVQWTAAIGKAKVDDYAIVIYFSPLPAQGTDDTVYANEYRQAAGSVGDAETRKKMTEPYKVHPRGINRKPQDGSGMAVYPILSEVFVLYDAQFSNMTMRVKTNVERYARVAVHESAHGKCEGFADLHQDGGGSAFADVHDGSRPFTPANRDFLAQYVWKWGPQYILGKPLSKLKPP